jgi:RNA polymerase sigma factor (sigma-70 family)
MKRGNEETAMMPATNSSERRQPGGGEGSSDVDNTIELVLEAKRGDGHAIDALLRHCLPRLQRWAHGRLPAIARGQLDTCDLVQEVALHTLGRLATFEPRQQGGITWYLRQAAMNRIRDEIRKVTRRPRAVEVPENLQSNRPSPLADAIEAEDYRRYRRALSRLSPKDRALIAARIDRGWSNKTIAARLGLPSVSAANMAVLRAARRLAKTMAAERLKDGEVTARPSASGSAALGADTV